MGQQVCDAHGQLDQSGLRHYALAIVFYQIKSALTRVDDVARLLMNIRDRLREFESPPAHAGRTAHIGTADSLHNHLYGLLLQHIL